MASSLTLAVTSLSLTGDELQPAILCVIQLTDIHGAGILQIHATIQLHPYSLLFPGIFNQHHRPNSLEVFKQNVQIALDQVATIHELARSGLNGILFEDHGHQHISLPPPDAQGMACDPLTEQHLITQMSREVQLLYEKLKGPLPPTRAPSIADAPAPADWLLVCSIPAGSGCSLPIPKDLSMQYHSGMIDDHSFTADLPNWSTLEDFPDLPQPCCRIVGVMRKAGPTVNITEVAKWLSSVVALC
ncbi:hypothetical protein BKA83DRAFT_4126693 [Pisolithus microcarpus]|nr:hypothetical protein BKA83DRAFT_4126693 [Pisolithus microcarpus]